MSHLPQGRPRPIHVESDARAEIAAWTIILTVFIGGGIAFLIQGTPLQSSIQTIDTAPVLAVACFILIIEGAAIHLMLQRRKLRQQIAEHDVTDYQEFLRVQRETALRRVNVNPDTSLFILNDIGLLVFEKDIPKPYISRYATVPTNVVYIKPFMELGSRLNKHFEITLEIIDDNKTLLFSEVIHHQLSFSTLILPKQHLDLSHYTFHKEKEWSLRVRLDGTLLAIHVFRWDKLPPADLLKQRRMDGEISPQLSRLIDDNQLTSLSLDDLLATKEINNG